MSERDPGSATGGAPGRIPTEQPWVPLRLERVVEVAYEHTEGGYPSRFRHAAPLRLNSVLRRAW
ncbi:hypothetical protein [Actinokineospora sp. NBRC 105648]|uniref:hypothetical protein n=1 Tax=Actinokineospora sp. NBRC 105648 TaxID=3032206 RepID=UPI002554D29C|nr:hypothetical protein [Actinokineospora sp. NBRC 105648]